MYGLRGARGFGDYTSDIARPVYVDPGVPPDPAIVAANTAANNAYQVAVAGDMAKNTYDTCVSDAGNNPAQYQGALLARCAGNYQDAGAYAASTAVTPVTWYSGGGTAVPFEGFNAPV